MLKLYGIDFSSRSNKVKMCANALDIPLEFVVVDMLKGEHKKPEHLKLHPAGKIPVINDDGFVLFESVAIMKYLCRKQRSDLYPSDVKQQALVDQWCDYACQHLDVQVVRVAFNVFVAPKVGQPVSQKSIEMGTEMIHQIMPVFESQLAKSEYIAGSQLSIADINLIAITDPLDMLKIDLSRYAKFSQWRVKIKAMSFYKETKTAFSAS